MSESPKHIEVFEEHGEHYALITFESGRKCIDMPEYDANDADNQPETIAEYAQRLSNEWEGATVYLGEAPRAHTPVDLSKPIAKYREQVGAVLGHFLLYADGATERISKQRYSVERVPERTSEAHT